MHVMMDLERIMMSEQRPKAFSCNFANILLLRYIVIEVKEQSVVARSYEQGRVKSVMDLGIEG